jgi:hypothetical protein
MTKLSPAFTAYRLPLRVRAVSMNSAKLRRSRDVPGHKPVKIRKCCEISGLAMFKHGLLSRPLVGGVSEREHLVTVLPFPTPVQQPKQTRRPRQPAKHISLRQARSLMEGLSFAREIGTPLNTHLIIHWGGTLAGDDPDGTLFAKLRYLLDKWFRGKFGIELTAIWIRERHRNKRTRRQSEIGHSHLLFYLPPQHRIDAKTAIEELCNVRRKTNSRRPQNRTHVSCKPGCKIFFEGRDASRLGGVRVT